MLPTILMLLQQPQDDTMILPPSPLSPLLTLLHPRLIFSAYNPNAPVAPSRYDSNTALILNAAYHPYTPSAASRKDYDASPPLLTLPHPCHLQSLFSRGTLKICPQCCPQPPLRLLSTAYYAYAQLLHS
ncbi:hypothetical protein O181_001669 [Austropuccinia psidii MF-1]|uniref:Uncharacterized protein n=1 Tax=Austropuccinia psidii MF-1 TaxID=1389203 RepID=A0A9Q3BAZ3_9BASI|nr:hypothetical protein [Austropuccinia psidii MF-1]